ncbi:8-oxo-dGTP diphosphatase [Desulfovibrionales bacterium]
MRRNVPCPNCGHTLSVFCNPTPTVDVIIQLPGRGIVLIERRNSPSCWALPGGFVDLGETAEAAAVREAREETGLEVELTGLFGVYSDPIRDPRQHTLSVVYIGVAVNFEALAAGDDAGRIMFFFPGRWPEPLAFDHRRILDDFLHHFERLNNYSRG